MMCLPKRLCAASMLALPPPPPPPPPGLIELQSHPLHFAAKYLKRDVKPSDVPEFLREYKASPAGRRGDAQAAHRPSCLAVSTFVPAAASSVQWAASRAHRID